MDPATPDGDGSFAQDPRDADPAFVFARIAPATPQDLERIAPGTVSGSASHVITMPYHPGVSTESVILFRDRTFRVTGVASPEDRQVETVVIAQELLS